MCEGRVCVGCGLQVLIDCLAGLMLPSVSILVFILDLSAAVFSYWIHGDLICLNVILCELGLYYRQASMFIPGLVVCCYQEDRN